MAEGEFSSAAVRAGTHRLTLVFEARTSAPYEKADARRQFWDAVIPNSDATGAQPASAALGPLSSDPRAFSQRDEKVIANYESRFENQFGPVLRKLVLNALGNVSAPPNSSQHPGHLNEVAREFQIVARIRRYGSLEAALTVFGLGRILSLFGIDLDAILALFELYAPEAFSQSLAIGSAPVTATLITPPDLVVPSLRLGTAAPNPRVAQIRRFLDLSARSLLLLPVFLALVIAYVWFAASHDELERARIMQRDLTSHQEELLKRESEQLQQYRTWEQILIERLLSRGDSGSPPRPPTKSETPTGESAVPFDAPAIEVPAVVPNAQLPGVVRLRTPRYLWVLGVALVGVGITLWRFLRRSTLGTASAAALVSIGTLTATSSLHGEFNVDSIFRIEKVPITVSLPRSTPLLETGAQHLGTVSNFKLASDVLDSKDTEVAQVIDGITKRWAENRGAGKTGILLLVGSADRVPLRRVALRRFESNFGLARARAEAIKSRLQDAFKALPKEQGVDDRQILVLVSGPRSTPDLTADYGGALVGFPSDRSVDVWAIWGWQRQPVPITRQ